MKIEELRKHIQQMLDDENKKNRELFLALQDRAFDEILLPSLESAMDDLVADLEKDSSVILLATNIYADNRALMEAGVELLYIKKGVLFYNRLVCDGTRHNPQHILRKEVAVRRSDFPLLPEDFQSFILQNIQKTKTEGVKNYRKITK